MWCRFAREWFKTTAGDNALSRDGKSGKKQSPPLKAWFRDDNKERRETSSLTHLIPLIAGLAFFDPLRLGAKTVTAIRARKKSALHQNPCTTQ
ncbi:hypothetical protein DVZ90_06470 [Vibrio cholerae]|nr:hypothetical protein [Vibrio cholerae]